MKICRTGIEEKAVRTKLQKKKERIKRCLYCMHTDTL